jgi:hypothetical protein
MARIALGLALVAIIVMLAFAARCCVLSWSSRLSGA